MKKVLNSILMVLMICVMLSGLGLAKDKGRKVVFPRDVMVQGTLVKKGTYQVVFDEQANKLTILQDDKTIATSTARAEAIKNRATNTELLINKKDNASILRGVILAGENQAVVIDDTVQTATPQQ